MISTSWESWEGSQLIIFVLYLLAHTTGLLEEQIMATTDVSMTANLSSTCTTKKKKKNDLFLLAGFTPYSSPHWSEVSEGWLVEALELGILPVWVSTGKQRYTHSWSCSLHPGGFPGGQRHRDMGADELYNKLTGFEAQNVTIWTWCFLLCF